MKFLIHSNGPHVKTGYGVQTALLADRLANAGHEVAISCTYGQQGAMGTWISPSGHSITLYPVGYEVNSNDVLHDHAMHFFEGDREAGWIIPLLDVWCLTNPLLRDFKVAAWAPVDHFPVPIGVLQFFERTGATPIAMSRYGERLFFESGLAPLYIPLAVDTEVMRQRDYLTIAGRTVSPRELLGLPESAFVVGIVAMNKGWARDRKGFNEALRAFAHFSKQHPDALLYMHSEKLGGAEGMNLEELSIHAGIDQEKIVWANQYAYRLGLTPVQMSATYSAFDVLLAPSHGEGFCVPLIEAQACGTPVIATDFSSQSELIGAGWSVMGQPEWDPAQHASYVCPYVGDVVRALDNAYDALQDPGNRQKLADQARAFALGYSADVVFEQYWQPFIDSLNAEPVALELERQPIPDTAGAVAVIVPAQRRPGNVARLVESLNATSNGQATAYFICEPDDEAEMNAVAAAGAQVVIAPLGATTYAAKLNIGYQRTSEPWLFVCGDDVSFAPGWLDAARQLSDCFDVIGTNDSAGAPKNPEVAAGRHADHFFIRRSYVATYGASLDGPDVVAAEVYGHWYVDKEIVELAKARNAFSPCLASVVEHHHPGYEGREDLRQADPVYMSAVASSDADRKTYLQRTPLIEMQRRSL